MTAIPLPPLPPLPPTPLFWSALEDEPADIAAAGTGAREAAAPPAREADEPTPAPHVGTVGTVREPERSEQALSLPVGELTAWLREGEALASVRQPSSAPSASYDPLAVAPAPQLEPDAWGLTAGERADSLARLTRPAVKISQLEKPTLAAAGHPPGLEKSSQLENSSALDPADYGEMDETPAHLHVWVEQTIPRHVMIAGLLAASRIRPAESGQAGHSTFAPPAPASEKVAKLATITPLPSSPVSDPWAARAAQLHDTAPLDGFTLRQWSTIATDAVALVATHAAQLRQLGWTDADLFGLHPDVLGRAVRGWGLALLIDGGQVVEVTATGATILRVSAARLTFTRRAGTGAVPIWEVGRRDGSEAREADAA